MEDFVRIIFYFFICLFLVTGCWVGFEYLLEGFVHTSKVDGYVAIILSGFIVDKYMDIIDKFKS